MMKFIRATLTANVLLLGVFAFLPVLAIKPDTDFMQLMLEFINKE